MVRSQERRQSSRLSVNDLKAAAEDGGAKKVTRGRVEAPVISVPVVKATRKSTAMPPPLSRKSENDSVEPGNIKTRSKVKDKLVVMLPALTKASRDASKRQALRDFTNNASIVDYATKDQGGKNVEKGKGRTSMSGQQRPVPGKMMANGDTVNVLGAKEAAGNRLRSSLAALKVSRDSSFLNVAPTKRTASLACSASYRIKSVASLTALQQLPSVSESVAAISLDSDGDDNVFDEESKRQCHKEHQVLGRKRKASSRTSMTKKAAKNMRVESCKVESLGPSSVESAMLPPGCCDIDAGVTDLFQCSSLVNDIIGSQRERERHFELSHTKLINHLVTSVHLRAVLVDWLVDVQAYLRLHDETLHLTIALTDRYLVLKPVDSKVLQLVGITALFVACKCEEKFTPQVKRLLHLCDNAYTFSEVINMELDLVYDLGGITITPQPFIFLHRFLRMFEDNVELAYASRYLLDLSLLDLECVSFRPSLKAAAAVCLANAVRVINGAGVPARSQKVKVTCSTEAWPLTARHYSQYSAGDLRPCMLRYAHLLASSSTDFQAVSKKFADPTMVGVIKDLHKMGNNRAVELLCSAL